MNRNERMIARKMFELAEQHGWHLMAVDNGDIEPDYIYDTDHAIELGCNLDMVKYVFQKGPKTPGADGTPEEEQGDNVKRGVVLMIFANGNDGLDAVSDYSINLEVFMGPLYAWILEFEDYYHGTEGYKIERFRKYNARDAAEFAAWSSK